MSRAWILALLTGSSTVFIKGAGALLPTGRAFSRVSYALTRATPVLLPGVLTALIVVQVFSTGNHLTIDSRVAGLLVAGTGARFRVAPAAILIAAAARSEEHTSELQ